MNNPFDYIPDPACDAAFEVLKRRVAELKKSGNEDDKNFCKELEKGKMLGVLIAEDSGGSRHTLYAFSGQLGNGGFRFPGFVEPVFDYLDPAGYYKKKEKEIGLLSKEIIAFENGELWEAQEAYCLALTKMDSEIEAYKEKCRKSKLERDARRKAGDVGEAEMAAMIRASQFEKAELHRLKKRLSSELDPYSQALQEAENHLGMLKEKRRSESEQLQKWLFSNFRVLNANGEEKSLSEIFAGTAMGIPPTGAGECCAPKLLQAAHVAGLKPVAIAEYWYGKPKWGELRVDGRYYPACRGKCLPVLGHMLQGLEVDPPLEEEHHGEVAVEPEIIYENRWFCVVEKPAGMLSVPGKVASKSMEEWLAEKYGPERNVRMAHRLDQDTSGLLIAAFGELSYKTLQMLFATRQMRKSYVADLEGDFESLGIPAEGVIKLPLSADYMDRPRQRIDYETGKPAATEYEIIGRAGEFTRVLFRPLTGRTHQLRVHSAASEGLGMPIAGDRLYGSGHRDASARLHLHAHKIEFTFPLDGEHYCFKSPVPF